MAPEERRTTILTAALPIVLEHGRAATTRQIAAAAGVAEGTLFRVFDSKEELFDAVLASAFDPESYLSELAAIDPELPVSERMLALTTIMQRRFVGIFRLMIALAIDRPQAAEAARHDEHEQWRQAAVIRMVGVLDRDASAFRLPLPDVVQMLRLLTFAGSHPHVSDQHPLTPEQIVDVVLNGTLINSGGER